MYKLKGIGGIHDSFSISKPTRVHKKEPVDNRIVHKEAELDPGKGFIMSGKKRKQTPIARKGNKKKKTTKQIKKKPAKPVKKKRAKSTTSKQRLKDRF